MYLIKEKANTELDHMFLVSIPNLKARVSLSVILYQTTRDHTYKTTVMKKKSGSNPCFSENTNIFFIF